MGEEEGKFQEADIRPMGLSCSQPVVSEDTLQAQVLWVSEILDEEIVPDSQSNFMANPPLIVKATGMTRKCKGCGSPLTDEDKAYPHDMVFLHLAVGGYYNQKYNRYMNQESHVHYHLNMRCLRKTDATIEVLYISGNDETFTWLDDQQMQTLKERGFLKPFARKKCLL